MSPSKVRAIFVANFFFSVHFAATLYINSSFLGHFFSPPTVGWLYVLGALGNIIFLLNSERLLSFLGGKGFLAFFTLITLFSTIGAALAKTPIVAIISFLVYASVSMMVYYAFDVLLEEVSDNKTTGKTRGIYLTITNSALLGGPILVALTENKNNFADLYIVSAFFLLPIIILMMFSLKIKKGSERYLPVALPFGVWNKLSNVRNVTVARIVLEFFFAIMVIFLPIYLNQTIGFSWREIGIIFTIMLLPFVLFEWPVGELADRRYGEKEIMSSGFLFIMLASLLMPFLGNHLVVWGIVLFVSRIGASFVEITTDSYFFKQVGPHHVGLISIYRLSRPVGLILGSGFGSVASFFLPQNGIFLILGIMILIGFRQAFSLVDTK